MLSRRRALGMRGGDAIAIDELAQNLVDRVLRRLGRVHGDVRHAWRGLGLSLAKPRSGIDELLGVARRAARGETGEQGLGRGVEPDEDDIGAVRRETGCEPTPGKRVSALAREG